MDIKNHFCLQPVGQGFFYTGQLLPICGSGQAFNFIYDCGSTRGKGIRPIIDKYIKENIGCDTLDMIVISHFDADHVNGIPYLLRDDQGVRVRRVYVPYYDVEDYLLVVVWMKIFHLEDRIDSVVFVTTQNNEDFKELYRSDPTQGLYRPREEKYSINRSNFFRLISHGEEEYLEKHYWRFKFYNRPIKFDRKLTIKEKIDQLLSEHNCKDLSDLVAIKEVRQKLKNIYIENTKNPHKEKAADVINTSSLCIYHGPLRQSKTNIDILCSFYPPKQKDSWMEADSFCWHRVAPMGTLLTGDISFAVDTGLTDFVAHYKEDLDLVGIFSVPHHGSRLSWNDQILNYFSQAMFICSYGLRNVYYHPSFKVIAALGDAQKTLFFSTERHMVEYNFFIRENYMNFQGL